MKQFVWLPLSVGGKPNVIFFFWNILPLKFMVHTTSPSQRTGLRFHLLHLACLFKELWAGLLTGVEIDCDQTTLWNLEPAMISGSLDSLVTLSSIT